MLKSLQLSWPASMCTSSPSLSLVRNAAEEILMLLIMKTRTMLLVLVGCPKTLGMQRTSDFRVMRKVIGKCRSDEVCFSTVLVLFLLYVQIPSLVVSIKRQRHVYSTSSSHCPYMTRAVNSRPSVGGLSPRFDALGRTGNSPYHLVSWYLTVPN